MRPNYFPIRTLRAGILTAIACQLVPGPSPSFAQAQAPQNAVLSGGAGKPTLVERPNNMRPTANPAQSSRSMDTSQQMGVPVPAYPTSPENQTSPRNQNLLQNQTRNGVIQASATAPAAPPVNSQSAASHNTAPTNPLSQAGPLSQNSAPPQTTVAKTPLPPASQLPSAEGPRKGGTLQMLMSVGSSLLIVVGLFLGVAWCYRKTLNSSFSGGLPKEVVNVVGRTPLAARQQLVLVRFGSKLVLVSMIQGEARTISEITDPLEVDQLVGLCASAQPGSISESFRSVLNQGATA